MCEVIATVVGYVCSEAGSREEVKLRSGMRSEVLMMAWRSQAEEMRQQREVLVKQVWGSVRELV